MPSVDAAVSVVHIMPPGAAWFPSMTMASSKSMDPSWPCPPSCSNSMELMGSEKGSL